MIIRNIFETRGSEGVYYSQVNYSIRSDLRSRVVLLCRILLGTRGQSSALSEKYVSFFFILQYHM